MRKAILVISIFLLLGRPSIPSADQNQPVITPPSGLFIAQPAIATFLKNNITITKTTPGKPASLTHGEQVTIAFKYTKIYQGEVRVTAQPFAGKRAMTTSSSPLYSSPNGGGICEFTIPAGKDLMINRIKLVMTTTQGKILVKKELPVQLFFSDDPLALASTDRPIIMQDGGIHYKNPDKSTLTLKLNKGILTKIHRTPTGKITGQTNTSVYYSTYAPPPDMADSQWTNNLENALKADLVHLTGGEETESFKNYMLNEAGICNSIYERITLRQMYVGLLLRKFDLD